MKKVALITGASSGIGFEFAFEIAAKFQYGLVLVARRLERLESLKNQLLKKYPHIEVYVFAYDLASESSREALWLDLSKLGIKVELLVNNAGFGSFGYFSEQDLKNQLKMINLNISALVDLTHKCLPYMISNNHGYIINVSSMASFQGLPFLSTYAATKSFVTSFSLALNSELNKFGIIVQALCPGPVPTEFGKIAGFNDKISITNSIPAKVVVEKSVGSLFKSSSLVIPGILNWLLAQANRFIPRSLSSKLAYLLLKNKKLHN